MSDRFFKVVIHFSAEYGQITYDQQEKTVRVELADSEKKRAVEQYLSGPHVIEDADGEDLRTFHAKNIDPMESLASLKLALTRMWFHTGVYVDWSRPAH